MVKEIIIKRDVADAEGITGTALQVMRPTASVKREEDTNDDNESSNENRTGGDNNEAAAASSAATTVTPTRKRKAENCEEEVEVEGLVNGERTTAQVVPVSPSDPLIQFRKIKSMPSSISGVIRLMDVLHPGQNYYARQKDGRGECSKMRGKLRKYAKSNEKKLGVVHWVETKNWKPPNDEALSALMIIMRGMINKSWPKSVF